MRLSAISAALISALWSAVWVMIGITAATGALGQSTPPPPSYHFASGDSALTIPVELVANGLVFVHVKINDHPRAGRFILDNASQGFTVDREYARQIGLTSTSSGTARGGGANTIDVGVIHDVRIGLPGLDLTHRNLVAIELKALEPSVGHEVDGIIGSRLFDDFVVDVDYEHRLLSIYSPKEYKPPEKATAFPVRIDSHGFPFLEATIALPGMEPVAGSFLIDGGANTYADVYKPFADAHRIPPSSMKLLDDPGTSTGGTTLSRDGRAERISIGQFFVKDAPVTFARDSEGLMAAQDYAGLIGTEFLQRFRVVFDNPGKRLWLTPNSSYGAPAAYDESGLRIRAEGPGFHKFVIGRIVLHSAAAKAGIQAGDIIESIDNRLAENLSLTEVRQMLAQPKARLSVVITRGNSHLRIALQLRPIL
jgi:hypothetical protein